MTEMHSNKLWNLFMHMMEKNVRIMNVSSAVIAHIKKILIF